MFERARAAASALRDEKERAAGRPDHIVTVQTYALSLASLKAVVQVSLIELYADPPLTAPDDLARLVASIDNQRKMLEDSDRGAHVQRRADRRYVADHAVDRAAAELDCSGFQDAMSKGCTALPHGFSLNEKS
jgi:hypothetical protein